MRQVRKIALVLVLLGTSCSIAAPTMADVAGLWTGTACAPSTAPACAIGFSLSQTGSTVSGTWSEVDTRGTLDGTVSGLLVTMNLNPAPPSPNCHTTSSATVAGNQMSGTIFTACSDGKSGTQHFTATR